MHAEHREALSKPTTTGTSERSERESFRSSVRRHILNHTALKKNPSLDCEALRKPTTTGTSERSERESYSSLFHYIRRIPSTTSKHEKRERPYCKKWQQL